MDDMSMISARMLHHIKSQCSSIFANNKKEFGSIFVYMFGDFRQLPPVTNTELYRNEIFNDDAWKGSLILKLFEHVTELSVAYKTLI